MNRIRYRQDRCGRPPETVDTRVDPLVHVCQTGGRGEDGRRTVEFTSTTLDPGHVVGTVGTTPSCRSQRSTSRTSSTTVRGPRAETDGWTQTL